MTSIERVFPPAVVLEMHCRNSHPIDGVKCTRVGPILPAGQILMEGRPRTNPDQDRLLAQSRSSGQCQRLKSHIYFTLSVLHSTSITNFPQENLLSEAFSLPILSLTVFILHELFTLSLSSTLSLLPSQP